MPFLGGQRNVSARYPLLFAQPLNILRWLTDHYSCNKLCFLFPAGKLFFSQIKSTGTDWKICGMSAKDGKSRGEATGEKRLEKKQ